MKRLCYNGLFILAASLLSCATLFAIPARRDTLTILQPDGTTILATNNGDEYCHYLTDLDGNILLEDSDGFYRVADRQTVSAISMQQQHALNQKRKPAVLTPNIAERGLVILANFSDTTFLPDNDLESMRDMFCGTDYTYNGATGSARQYFYDQSFGTYNPRFDVVGPVRLPNTSAYYGRNNRVGAEPSAHFAIRDACLIADSVYDIDFSLYDNDKDGILDFVFVVYAGHNEAEGATTTTIWPHAWNLLDAGLRLAIDGVLLGRYACTSELCNDRGTVRAGIGTFCHEFGHVLGLPDIYPTNLLTHRTLGSWDIMDYGGYNNEGRTPPAYSAYERYFLGWAKPTLLNEPNDYFMRDIASTNACAMITQNGQSNLSAYAPDPSVYYLLENRQQHGWDTYLPGHGLIITRIQYNENRWISNTVNNTASDMGIDMIEAGGNTKKNDDTQLDLFPAGATSYVPYVFYPVLDIAEDADGIISFRFMSGSEGRQPVEIIGDLPTDLINIRSESLSESDIISIYSISGQRLQTNSINSLPHGMYIITTQNGNLKLIK